MRVDQDVGVDELQVFRLAHGVHLARSVSGHQCLSLSRDSIASSIAEASGEARLIDVQPYAVQLRGTDEVIGFRVQYAIGSTCVIDYRYRFVVDNALANVIVTARAAGTGEASATFREQARAIVEQQIAHLTEARR